MRAITPQQWQRVQVTLDQLELLAPEQRAEALAGMAISDEVVLAELRSLLDAAARQGEGFLAASPFAAAGTAATMAPGTRIGAFEIESLIGHGGMAQVYRARRVGEFDQVVAIKLVTESASARPEYFQRERRIVAALEHPGIARLIDGGIADSGRPYMVMEYVDGTDLIHHAQQQRLGLEARLDLFRQVCEAVSFAHRHLVIHRDLKPANIRVTPQGQVKLLDFGVAKLLETERRDDALDTATVLTPEFAAPEQLYGEHVTTAADVYALGAVLHQLLTGVPPFETRGMPLHVAIDLLLRSDAPLPSVTAARQAEPPVPAKRLRGDLDAIVQRAMRRKPAERYASVQELQADVGRHLDGRPVYARRGSTAYLVSRLVRRHRMAVAAAAVSLIAVVAGLAVALWQADAARRSAARAQVQAQRAERTKDLLLTMIGEQDVFARSGAKPRSVADLIASGLAAAEQQLADDPDLRADLLHDVGLLQMSQEQFDAARLTLERAERDRAALYGDDSLERVETLAATVRNEVLVNHVDAARRAQQAGQAILERRNEPHHPLGAEMRLRVGIYLISGPESAEVLAQSRQAMKDIDAAYAPGDPRAVVAASLFGTILEQARKDDVEAIAAVQEALRRAELQQGPEGAALLVPLGALRNLQWRTGNSEAALRTGERAIRIARASLGDVNEVLASSESSQANVLADIGRLDEAADGMRRAIAALPADASAGASISTLRNYGRLQLQRKRYDEAEPPLRKVFELSKTQGAGENNAYTWFLAGLWGEALTGQKRYDEAEKLQREALRRMSEILGPDAYQNAFALQSLASTLSARKQYAEAVELLRRALVLSEMKYPGGHPISQSRRLDLASMLVESGTPAARTEAGSLADIALAFDPRAAGSEESLGMLHLLRGRLRLARGETAEARRDLEQAVSLLSPRLDRQDEVAEAKRLLAMKG